ncbi:hypothetical protein ACPXCE_17715 [Streptomyces sp. DT24]|uniref:hypothetical protein n=1 Tax=Streptomyces sp. DT24 TaxID=3416520 RepID=UPI003CF998A3
MTYESARTPQTPANRAGRSENTGRSENAGRRGSASRAQGPEGAAPPTVRPIPGDRPDDRTDLPTEPGTAGTGTDGGHDTTRLDIPGAGVGASGAGPDQDVHEDGARKRTPSSRDGHRTSGPAGNMGGAGAAEPLFPSGEQDQLAARLQQAVSDFVESPRRAVEEADRAFDEIVTGLTDALARRRDALRAGWQGQDTEAQTEELRIALQRYRESAELLLRV